MESLPDIVASSPLSSSASDLHRRAGRRQKVSSLAYVTLDDANGGIIRDVSECGVALQTVSPLRMNQAVHLRFDLPQPRLHIETAGRVAWSDTRGQAGIAFLNLAERSRRLIKQWIFTQLLARAQQVVDSGADFALSPDSVPAELHFSASPRTAIRLESVSASGESSCPDPPIVMLQFPWCPFSISPHAFARSVDALILFVAVLLFSVLAISMTESIPGWPVAISLLLAAASLLSCAYWFLFVVWVGETPGAHLARIAGATNAGEEEEDRQRFR